MSEVIRLYRYFAALHKGEVPPVKARLEQDLPPREERVGGLTKGALSVLHSQVAVLVHVAVVHGNFNFQLHEIFSLVNLTCIIVTGYSKHCMSCTCQVYFDLYVAGRPGDGGSQ